MDYMDKTPSKCPKCGSPVKKLEDAFADDKITVRLTDTARRKRDHDIYFNQARKTVDGVIGRSLNKLIPEDDKREKFKWMIHVYVWGLLKREPQLWANIGSIITDIKDLVTLRLVQDKERYCDKCEFKKEK